MQKQLSWVFALFFVFFWKSCLDAALKSVKLCSFPGTTQRVKHPSVSWLYASEVLGWDPLESAGRPGKTQVLSHLLLCLAAGYVAGEQFLVNKPV